MNSWTKFNGEWAIRTQSGNTGDTVTVVSNSGKSSKVRLGKKIRPGVFEVFKNANAAPRAPKPITQTSKAGFEVEPCTRCAGSGHFSYCEMYGTRCFQCAGRKEKYTDRGHAAFARFKLSLQLPAGGFQPGMFIKDDMTGRWHEVVTVRVENHNCVLKCEKYEFSCHIHTMVRKAWSDAEKQEKLKAALEYQKTL